MEQFINVTNPETVVQLNEDETKVVVTHKGNNIAEFDTVPEALFWTMDHAEEYGIESFTVSKDLMINNDGEDAIATRQDRRN